jgi:hypothetical protein
MIDFETQFKKNMRKVYYCVQSFVHFLFRRPPSWNNYIHINHNETDIHLVLLGKIKPKIKNMFGIASL